MAYRLKSDEKLARGFHRIANEQIAAVIQDLAAPDPRRLSKSIHQVRTHIKKIRALLRLVRSAAGKKFYHAQSQAFRDLAHSLSPLRDVEVRLKTLDKLGRSLDAQMPPEVFSTLLRKWSGEHHELLRQVKKRTEAYLAKLRTAQFQTWNSPLKNLGRKDIRAGIKKTCRQCAKDFKKSKQAGTLENLHEWRRHAKGLWYQLHLVKPLCAKSVGKLSKRLKRLGEHLGDDHDLALLAQAIEVELHAADVTQINEFIRARRSHLQHSALKLGRRLFPHRPARFVNHCF